MFENRKAFVLEQINRYDRAIARIEAEPEVQEPVNPYRQEEPKDKELKLAIKLRTHRQYDYESFRFVDRCLSWRAEHGIPIQEFDLPLGVVCHHGKKYQERSRRRVRRCNHIADRW